jgi:tRNA(fMet)-specific endonuclease VapC
MRYLLDSNAIITWFNGRNRALVERLKAHDGEFGTSTIVIFELYFGAFNSSRVADNIDRLANLKMPVLEFGEADARTAGEIRAALKKAGTPIGPYDLLIAAQAKSRGLVMVTNNVAEFSRVEGLVVEDWIDQASPT